MRTKLNFLELITEGNETQNIRLFDGDAIVVSRSPVELREQIVKAGQTNLSPDFLQVFVTGRVRDRSKVCHRGASRRSSLAAAGAEASPWPSGVHTLQPRRKYRWRKFFVTNTSPAGSYKNLLMAGDVVRVNDSPYCNFKHSRRSHKSCCGDLFDLQPA